MEIVGLDHLVLTVQDIERTCSFYHRVLGMQVQTYGADRKALIFGNQKINLHEQGRELEPRADKPRPGSADLCFITMEDMPDVIVHLKHCGIDIIEGPVARSGALGPMTSVYFRDPDGNLVEVSQYHE